MINSYVTKNAQINTCFIHDNG